MKSFLFLLMAISAAPAIAGYIEDANRNISNLNKEASQYRDLVKGREEEIEKVQADIALKSAELQDLRGNFACDRPCEADGGGAMIKNIGGQAVFVFPSDAGITEPVIASSIAAETLTTPMKAGCSQTERAFARRVDRDLPACIAYIDAYHSGRSSVCYESIKVARAYCTAGVEAARERKNLQLRIKGLGKEKENYQTSLRATKEEVAAARRACPNCEALGRIKELNKKDFWDHFTDGLKAITPVITQGIALNAWSKGIRTWAGVQGDILDYCRAIGTVNCPQLGIGMMNYGNMYGGWGGMPGMGMPGMGMPGMGGGPPFAPGFDVGGGMGGWGGMPFWGGGGGMMPLNGAFTGAPYMPMTGGGMTAGFGVPMAPYGTGFNSAVFPMGPMSSGFGGGPGMGMAGGPPFVAGIDATGGMGMFGGGGIGMPLGGGSPWGMSPFMGGMGGMGGMDGGYNMALQMASINNSYLQAQRMSALQGFTMDGSMGYMDSIQNAYQTQQAAMMGMGAGGGLQFNVGAGLAF